MASGKVAQLPYRIFVPDGFDGFLLFENYGGIGHGQSVIWIDGVPFAWAAPGARRRMIGFHRGHYVGQWRTFLGDDIGAPFPLTVPGTASIGVESDGGT